MIDLPAGPVQEYIRIAGILAVYVVAWPPGVCRIDTGRDLERTQTFRYKQGGDLTIVAAFWVDDIAVAIRIAGRVTRASVMPAVPHRGRGDSADHSDRRKMNVHQTAYLEALLIGAALRFLRGELELTQRNLAGILGATEQTLRLWEKNRGKPITGSADRLLRGVYAEFLGGNVQLRRMLERLAEFDRKKTQDAYFSN